MAYEPISGLPPQFSALADGTSASDYYLKFYAADGTTPINMATDTTGGTLLAKCKVNSTGYTVNGSNAVFIPHIDQEYKLALYPSEALADANTFASATWVVDDIPTRTSLASTIIPFATVAAAQAATGLASGMTICLADRASSLWDLSSSGTANGYNVIFLTASGLYATLREMPEMAASMFGNTVGAYDAFIDYIDTNQVDGVLDISYDLAGVTTHTITNSITIRGVNGATLSNADDELFYLDNSAYVKFVGVGFDGFTALMLEGAGVVDSIIYDDCTINNCVGLINANLTSLNLFSFHHCKEVADCVVNVTWCAIRADIAKADVYRNRFDNFSSPGNSCTIFLLGNTQLADQANTGNYFIDHNLVAGIDAEGTAQGECHFIQGYGDFVNCDYNIVKNVTRSGVGANSEGVEGIYLKMSRGSCTHNLMYKAGTSGGGNKGAMINIKGTPRGVGSGTVPISMLLTVSNNICDAGDDPTLAMNGIRCEGDYLTIAYNRTYECFYGVIYAGSGGSSPDDVYDVDISNNVISKTNANSAIWINTTGERISVKNNKILGKSATPLFIGDDYGILYTGVNRSGVIDDLDISDNKIVGFDYGVGVLLAGVTSNNLRVRRNDISDCSYAVAVANPANATNGLISDNDARVNIAFYPGAKPASANILQRNNYSNGVLEIWDAPQHTVGLGTPEGNVVAPIGNTYGRTDGGAGTSFYVKESGTGNTGWVAK